MHLAAIAPATKAVALGSAAVVVSGLSFRKLTRLIDAYPELVAFVAGGRIEIAALLREGPEAALAAFSLGVVGRPRQPWWRKAAVLISDGEDSDLVAAFEAAPAGQQVEILGAIFDLTVKGGERAIPFLTRMSGGNEPAPPSAAPPPPEAPTETSAASTPASSSA